MSARRFEVVLARVPQRRFPAPQKPLVGVSEVHDRNNPGWRMSRNESHNRSGAPKSPVIPGLGADLPELRQARAFWQLNRFDDSLRLFEEAARKHPQNLVALIDGSRALGARFEIGRAETLLDRLLTLGAQQPDVLH